MGVSPLQQRSRKPVANVLGRHIHAHALRPKKLLNLTGTLRALDCAPLQVGGVADHVHILGGLSRKISLAER
jgi:hypothetical protein